MTCLSIVGKIAVALHCKRNPGHLANGSANALGMMCWHCSTCGYLICTPERWAALIKANSARVNAKGWRVKLSFSNVPFPWESRQRLQQWIKEEVKTVQPKRIYL